MGANSYLQSLSSELIITRDERGIIDQHITTLESRLNVYFNSGQIKEKFPFGSFTRKTLMPRKADGRSDADYMVVFTPSKPSASFYGGDPSYYEPETYLTWLRSFVNYRYSTSEIYTSSPTIVLELSNFKIELVPAKKDIFGTYSIPSSNDYFTRWITTTPNQFNEKVRNKNTTEKSQIRPLIRLMKYWNAQHGYVFSSYFLEQLIVDTSYFNCNTIWEYLRRFVDNIVTINLSNVNKQKVERLKEACNQAYLTENISWLSGSQNGEEYIKKEFPAFKR
ncbi:SMODS domain-containing nucleotidyltransferase [Dyadobacter sp. 32]|uniref:SMODS domain-containing nucleotidyltransferase n=1 Tax=Dyadobacter sp. 32 TaxID=538966 RepID=UPI0011EBBF7B